MLTPSIYYFLQNILLQLFLNWPVLTVIQILQINLRITCILVLNSSVHSFPRLLNHHKYISNKITYHTTELISTIDLTAQLATNTTDIHIDDFNPKDRSQRAKVFVRFSNFNELFQFIFNEYYDINFEHLPKPVVFIDDIHDIEISQTNYNLLNRCFEKLLKNIGLAIAIKSTQQFETMKQLILTFYKAIKTIRQARN